MRYAMALATVLTMIGCADKQGATVAQWDSGKNQPMMKTAPHDGNYVLYTEPGMAKPMEQPVAKGDPIGFEKRDDGRVQAVGGPLHVVLRENTEKAYWKDPKAK